jgi:ribonuclease HI
MIHVVTDGVARPNPGSAGWGPIIRQNERCTWLFGHYDHATNNAMELRAEIEALPVLPEGMNV